MKTGTRYEANLKTETVKLEKEVGVMKASQDIGVAENTIRNWVKLRESRPANSFVGSGQKYISPEDAKVGALEKEKTGVGKRAL